MLTPAADGFDAISWSGTLAISHSISTRSVEKLPSYVPEQTLITLCRKIEGGFNSVLIFTLNNSKRVVAGLPFASPGPAKLATASEVARSSTYEPRLVSPHQ